MGVAGDAVLVSVVLPCFNAERFIAEAVESILSQTHRNLEILLLDDGSTDSTPQILRDYEGRDHRVRVLTNSGNQGLIKTLNRGVAEARGEFIARMDADDVAAHDRIERQVEMLARHPEIGVVGSGIGLISGGGRRIRPRPVRCLGPGGARFMALLGTPVVHVTVLARARLLKDHPYGVMPDSVHAEDYELWTRMLRDGVAFSNLDVPLVSVRVDPRGVSLSNEGVQVDNFIACAARYLQQTLDLKIPHQTHSVLVNRISRDTTARDLARGLRLLRYLQGICARREPAAAEEIRAIANMQRVDILIQAGRKGRVTVRAAAALLALRNLPWILSRPSRRYIALKLVDGSSSRPRLASPLSGAPLGVKPRLVVEHDRPR